MALFIPRVRLGSPKLQRAIVFSFFLATLWLVASGGGAVASPLGEGIEAASRGDRAAAIRILEPLAKNGDGVAAVVVGDMYESGVGGRKNFHKAMQWYRIAVDTGNFEGSNRIAGMFAEGKGVKKSRTEAIKWYEVGATRGHGVSQFNLGLFYADEKNGEPNYVLSYMWLTLADLNEAPAGWSALDFRNQIALQMTSNEIEEAERRVNAWRSAHYPCPFRKPHLIGTRL